MMASSMKLSVLFMFITLSILFSVSSSSPSLSSRCHPENFPFLRDLQHQCPTTIVYSSPIEMDGESLDRLLSSTNVYKAILFYASWCPFSRNAQPKFDALASMYPQIMHVKVKQSSALPSVFSKHGIHSVPSILIVNGTTRMQYHGPKNLHSLSDFYQRTTGLEPLMYLTEDQVMPSSENRPRSVVSWKDIMSEEPYLVFSLSLVLLKAFLILCPEVVSSVIALWVAYIPRLNLAIFGESRQVLTHALQLFDVKSAFSKLKVSKSRKFHNGARSARVLASLSLGETSSGRA
ncbi:5'-adenylylsulfate reductase-like 5 [Cynara cardunculus var. scolymus]|uniref:Thioredoxin domain-containing protein n=1 Tax=Cynara cardunculus var. scolymus TaxID=59895 RepID=A0A103YFU1_CYNCS|nr:5'-adenylylsulfate reductase-like 5 [Cynara cardunculus var. scolymus]KVI08322.1 Thioredoxin domain-containing protein [Cynara cardunculus var. scolymus]